MDTGFTFADIYQDIIDRVGGEQSLAEDVVRVRRGIRMILERWASLRYNTWRFNMSTVTATGSNRYVTLATNVDDVMQVTVDGGAAVGIHELLGQGHSRRSGHLLAVPARVASPLPLPHGRNERDDARAVVRHAA